MIPINAAVESAVAFARRILEPARAGNIMLEEVETGTVDGNEVWVITLSLPDPTPPLGAFGQRQYKTFTVDGLTGEVLSMKIRQLSTAT